MGRTTLRDSENDVLSNRRPPAIDVLGITELLDLILEQLGRRTLAQCALVCRAWQTPVLRVLRRCQSNRDSASLFKIYQGIPFSKGFLDEEGWNRFAKQCYWVRDLSMYVSANKDSSTKIEESLFRNAVTEAACRPTPLFPSLEYITIRCKDNASKSVIPLISSRIKEVSIVMDFESGLGALASILLRIQHHCPHLRLLRISRRSSTLNITANEKHPALLEALQNAIQNLPELRDVFLPTPILFHSSIWQSSLMTHQNLRQASAPLTLGKEDRLPPSLLSDYPPPYSPAAKRSSGLILLLGEIDYFLAESILTNTHFPALEQMFLTFRRFPGQRQVRVSMEDLVTSIFALAPALTSFGFSFPDAGFVLSIDDIIPLRLELSDKQTHLTMLHIQTQNVASLTDAEFGSLASGLPNLRSLWISPCPATFIKPPPATLLALDHIARFCRAIEDVAVCIDATKGVDPQQPLTSVFSATLETLNFGCSPVKDPLSVAFLLLDLTRKSKPTICSKEPHRPAWKLWTPTTKDWPIEQWKEVSDVMEKLRSQIETAKYAKEHVAVMEDRIRTLEGQLKERNATIQLLRSMTE